MLPRAPIYFSFLYLSPETDSPVSRIAIFASGGGSNARRILEHCAGRSDATVALVVSNRPGAGVLQHAAAFDVPALVIDRSGFYGGETLLDQLRQHRIDYIALAGFLWLVPDYLLRAFPDRILNIHPSLLPKHGGAGMYGRHVHRAVKAAGDTESGITIHLIDGEYDRGRVLFQARTPIAPDDTPECVAEKVLALEHQHYPTVLTDYMARSTAPTDDTGPFIPQA